MSLAASVADQLRWLRRSSTLRLTILLSVIFALGMAAAVVVTLGLGRDALMERTDDTLDRFADALEEGEAPEDSFYVLIRPVEHLRDLPREFAQAARQGGGTVFLEDDFRDAETWRAMVARDADGARVLIAVPFEDSEDALELLGGLLWTTASVVIGVALAIGLAAGLLAQRRLQRITRTLARLGRGDLNARTEVVRSRDDLDDLAKQLDATAEDLERLVTQTRHLSASIAHDLRTPLARLNARLEMLPDSEARSGALDEARRLSGIFDTIMRVARIEAQQGTEGFTPIDLGALLSDIAETFSPVVEDNGKRLHVLAEAPGTIEGDRQMLVQAVANLLQNALVHGGRHITLFARGTALGVADDGPGVDPSDYEEIMKPMVRLDAARSTDGSGLGLALVRAVADRHGARVRLAPEQPQGLRATLEFSDL